METIFEILKIILPAITTGVFTFFVTKYTYGKNRPLDKFEIAYNRVYYPLYRMISNDNMNIIDFIHYSEKYFLKYDKYIDISTKKIFASLKKCKNKMNRKFIYKNFKNNIYYKNAYLRRNLGYLESGFIQLYHYSMPYTKSLYRLIIEFCIMYLALVAFTISMEIENDTCFEISLIIFLFFSLIVFLEIIWFLAKFIYYKIIE